MFNLARLSGAEKPWDILSKMMPKVNQFIANWNPKGTTVEPNADQNASTNQRFSKNTFREVRDEGFDTILVPRGRFRLPFCRPFAFAGVLKSTSGT